MKTLFSLLALFLSVVTTSYSAILAPTLKISCYYKTSYGSTLMKSLTTCSPASLLSAGAESVVAYRSGSIGEYTVVIQPVAEVPPPIVTEPVDTTETTPTTSTVTSPKTTTEVDAYYESLKVATKEARYRWNLWFTHLNEVTTQSRTAGLGTKWLNKWLEQPHRIKQAALDAQKALVDLKATEYLYVSSVTAAVLTIDSSTVQGVEVVPVGTVATWTTGSFVSWAEALPRDITAIQFMALATCLMLTGVMIWGGLASIMPMMVIIIGIQAATAALLIPYKVKGVNTVYTVSADGSYVSSTTTPTVKTVYPTSIYNPRR